MSILSDPFTLPVEERVRPTRRPYWRGWSSAQIADGLAVRYDTVKSRRRCHAWDDAPSIRKLEDCLETRLMVLICKEKKTGADYTELDALRRQVEIRAKVRRYEAPGGHSGDLNDKVANRNAGERKKTKKNHFTADQAAELKAIFLDQLHGYQEAWFAALTFRTRMILQSWQIGVEAVAFARRKAHARKFPIRYSRAGDAGVQPGKRTLPVLRAPR